MSEQVNTNSQDLISDLVTETNPLVSGKWKTIVIVCIMLLALINLIIGFTGNMEGVTQLDGSAASKEKIIQSLLLTLFIYIPILGFILGTLTSLLPFKNAEYSKKYLPISLLTILALEVIIILMRIVFW
jgi:hypothetical protein